MILGIFARTFSATNVSGCLEQAASAGYACVQFNMRCAGLPAMPDAIPDPVKKEIARASRAVQVPIAAVSGTYNMVHPDLQVRKQGRHRLRVLAGACGEIGTSLITLCTGSRDPDDPWRFHRENGSGEAWRDLLGEMEHAIRIAEECDVRLGVEPELANVVSSAERARRLIEELGSDRIRIVFDPANLFDQVAVDQQRATVSEALTLLGSRIALSHAKDRSADGSFTHAGNGVLDYRHYVAGLRSVGFDGPLIAHGLSPSEAPIVAKFLGGLLERRVEG